MNFKTLRRISEGKAGKNTTDAYYLKAFVTIINDEYECRLRNGGDGASDLLVCMKNILLATL